MVDDPIGTVQASSFMQVISALALKIAVRERFVTLPLLSILLLVSLILPCPIWANSILTCAMLP